MRTEYSDQAEQMHKLIRVLAGCKAHALVCQTASHIIIIIVDSGLNKSTLLRIICR